MAVESDSFPRDNSLEELRVVIEEKKGEVKTKFAELKKLLEISENTATKRLDRIYTEEREGVERIERTVTQLEQAKNAVNSTLVDNTMNSLLQTTIQNFDDQIAKARNSACVVPKHISLRWSIEELKQSIENVCEVISSSTVKGHKPEVSSQSTTSKQTTNEITSYQTEIQTLQTELAHAKKQLLEREEISQREINMLEDQKDKDLEGVRKELEQRTKELVSLQKKKLQMQEKYQNEVSNSSLRLKELNKECSLLSINPPQKQIEQYETNTQDLKSQISLLRNQLESKETESSFLRDSLNDSKLENTILWSQQTQQFNPTKVQSKRDLQTGTVVNEKQVQYTQVVTKHKQQPKYATTILSVHGKYSQFYTLNQVDNPSEIVGELVVCRSKWKYVIGTLKIVIPAKLRYDKTMAGIEFTDKFGDCSGSYLGITYFKTNSKYALFIPTTQVYISYNESPK